MVVHKDDAASDDASGATGSAPAEVSIAALAGERFGELMGHLAAANLLGQELREIGFKVKFNTYNRNYEAVCVEVTGPDQPEAER